MSRLLPKPVMMLGVRLANNQPIDHMTGERSIALSTVPVPEHFLGFGLGLITEHFQDVLNDKPNIDWFEVVSENFMVDGGKPKHYLHSIREHYLMVMHGVALSIGSTDPLNFDYLRKLLAYFERLLMWRLMPKILSALREKIY